MQTKICKGCNQEIDINLYYPHKYGKYGVQSKCKACMLKDSKEHYRNNKGQRREINTRAYKKRKEAIQELKGPCVVCGWFEYPEAIDFHHLDPSEKDFSVADKWGKAWEKVKAEIDKCVCLCANCHRGVHAGKVSLPNE